MLTYPWRFQKLSVRQEVCVHLFQRRALDLRRRWHWLLHSRRQMGTPTPTATTMDSLTAARRELGCSKSRCCLQWWEVPSGWQKGSRLGSSVWWGRRCRRCAVSPCSSRISVQISPLRSQSVTQNHQILQNQIQGACANYAQTIGVVYFF